MKYLIVGLGNIGTEYENTRHNIGFMVVDAMADGQKFSLNKNAFFLEVRNKGRTYVLIKPTTYMNLSGKAVAYHLKDQKIPLENLLIITDDLALPFGMVRIRKSGSDGGHNGLKSINESLGTNAYSRMRVGIDNKFPQGRQVDYVLSPFTSSEQHDLPKIINHCANACWDFGFLGIDKAMSEYNKNVLEH
jgi:PTH1 family peptidyl-tRNA hydrolase